VRTPLLATFSVAIGIPLLLAGVIAGVSPVTAAAARTGPAGPAASFVVSGDLRGVAATSATNAWTVGGYGSVSSAKTLIARWNGTAWTRVPSPTPAGGGELSGVAATSASSAWAVGCTSCFTSSPKTLILHWNGKTWTRVPSPAPADSSLSGVAAVSASNAWAVGCTSCSHIDSFKGLILGWNGKAWRRVPSPLPAYGKYGNALAGVAATSARNAWAVGCTDGCPVGGTPVIERWNGTAWKQVAPPTTPYGLYNLAAVAATSTASAWAVGGGGPVTSEGTATAHWNGRRWTLSHGRSGAELAGVAATSATNAWAVGGTASGRTLILRWNGTTWKLN